ncbi:RBBP9/YdeN family alpha/beta hydrolase [Chthonobacter albigriseus]|uniref:RBBP9/YdeN family alpha/beta hydrolase n=1 Tax=Chthonobacter albigriseus TaxID=1683161 RepID=UPI0015EEF05A|nr:alpha/beta hydrolase [Chthonobacter albigriseus]
MKTAECDILIVPGLGNSGPDHWQSRWERQLPTARRAPLGDWDDPDRATWVERLVQAVCQATRPVVIVAHSLGVMTVAHAAPELEGRVRAAFLVAPPDTTRKDMPPEVSRTFRDVPREPLPFPSMLIASRNDPYCAFDAADDFAAAWGSLLVDAGEAGHINAASGHGPWPEGLTRFATLLQRI